MTVEGSMQKYTGGEQVVGEMTRG